MAEARGPAPMDVDEIAKESDAPGNQPAVVPQQAAIPPKKSRKRRMETDGDAAHVSKKRRTHPKTPQEIAGLATEEKKEPPPPTFPVHFQVKYQEYVGIVREAFLSFPDLASPKQIMDAADVTQLLRDLVHEIHIAPNVSSKEAFINRPDVTFSAKYEPLFAVLVQNSSETLSDLCHRISWLFCKTFKEELQSMDTVMTDADASETNSDEKTPDAVSQFMQRLESLEQDIREMIIAVADRKTYGSKPKNKKQTYRDESCLKFDRGDIPMRCWQDCRLCVWETRKLDYLPSECVAALSSALGEMKQLTTRISKYREYLHKYETALKPSKETQEKKVSKLQQILDSIGAWELSQKEKQQKEFERKEKKRLAEEKKLKTKQEREERKRAKEIAKEKAKEAKAKTQLKIKPKPLPKTPQMSDEEKQRMEEKRRLKEENDRIQREKSERDERQKISCFFKPQEKKSRSSSVFSTRSESSSNDTESVSYYKRRFKPFAKRNGCTYGELTPIGGAFRGDQIGCDNETDLATCRNRLVDELRLKRRPIPPPTLMPRCSAQTLAQMRERIRQRGNVDEDGKEREPVPMNGCASAPIVLDDSPTAMDVDQNENETKTNGDVISFHLRYYTEDYRPAWFGGDTRHLKSKKCGRKPFSKFQPRSYDSDDSGIEWYGDQESDGESLGDDEDRSDDETERKNLRDDGFEVDEFLVAAEDPDFGDKEFFDRKHKTGAKDRFPIDFGTRVRGDDKDAPIVIKTPRFISRIKGSSDPRENAYCSLAERTSYLIVHDVCETKEDGVKAADAMDVSEETPPDVEMTEAVDQTKGKENIPRPSEIVQAPPIQPCVVKKKTKITPMLVPMETTG